MRMRKRRLLVLFILMTGLLLFTACTTKQTAKKGRAEHKKQLVIGYDLYKPYAYINDKGKCTGSDIEIAREACRRMGYQPVFQRITWGDQNNLLQKKAVDCIWCGFSVTGREKQYQWTRPYLKCYQKVVVRSDSDIKKLSDLQGKRVAVQLDTKTEQYFLEQLSRGKLQVAQISTCKTLMEAVAIFNKGYADAFAAHDEAIRQYTKENPKAYRVLDESIMKTQLGVAFSLDYDKKTVKKLSDTLDEMIKDKTIKKIVMKYGINSNQLMEVE